MKIKTLSLLCISFFLLVIISCKEKKPLPNVKNTTKNEQHRPQFHFSPDSMWTNDPNGMVYYNGEYHLFFQHYPDDNIWGPMHWGHTVSKDLVHWEQLPIALFPDSLGYIFSGSAVIDWENTSGLGKDGNPPMIAIFTHHNSILREKGSREFQYQSIAFSNDNGRSWTKYADNPVLENPGIYDFRDPKVIWFEEGKKWIMALAAKDRVKLYSSPDLINWSFESDFGENIGAHPGIWECPDFFPLKINDETKWALIVSINAGGPNGGSATQYFIGDFDGNQFIYNRPKEEINWIDYGKDNYAGVTWSDIPREDGRRIFMGWMSNWQYANIVPTEVWRNAMTIPRVLELKKDNEKYYLTCHPVKELEKLRQEHKQIKQEAISGEKDYSENISHCQNVFELDLNFSINNSQSEKPSEIGFVLSNNLGEKLKVGFNLVDENFFIDRSKAGIIDFSEEFPGKHTAPFQLIGDTKLRAFIDKSSIEVFVNDGELVMTELFFLNKEFDNFVIYSENGSFDLAGNVYSLNSIWK